MNLSEYQLAIERFVKYPHDVERQYLAFGLMSEIGELSGKFAKRLRGDTIPDSDVLLEIGDCLFFTRRLRERYGVNLDPVIVNMHTVEDGMIYLYEAGYQVLKRVMINNDITPLDLCMVEGYLARIAALHGATLDEVAELNYRKLADRLERGVITGDGDHR